ncbi:MAG: hypothetical protein AAF556_13335, partial [Pseudomonadota bacterium]
VAILLICFLLGVGLGIAGKSLAALPTWIAPAFLVTVGAASIYYWRTLDETARKAHKFSWYWGSTIGIATVIVLVLLDRSGLNFIQSLADAGTLGENSSEAFINGAYAIFLLQTVTSAGVWGIWWLRMR